MEILKCIIAHNSNMISFSDNEELDKKFLLSNLKNTGNRISENLTSVLNL